MATRVDTSIAEEHAKTLSELNLNELRKWIRKELSVLAVMTKETVTAEVLNGYVALLQDQPRHRLAKAFRKAATTLKFFPKPAELIELCEEEESRPELEKRTLCPDSCKCGGSGFIYGKYTKRYQLSNDRYEDREYDGVYPCPERMKRGKAS